VGNEIGVSDQTVRRWVKAGELAAYKPGKEYRIKGSDLEEFLKAREVSPKVQSPLPEADVQRRKSRLPEVADLLLDFAQLLLLSWQAELPSRAQANDYEWLANTAILWRAFRLSNYGVLKELSAEGLDDKQDGLSRYMARYMDINAIVSKFNAAMREHSTADGSPADEALVALEPLEAVT
jgi:excisionase family DNA binding protein